MTFSVFNVLNVVNSCYALVLKMFKLFFFLSKYLYINRLVARKTVGWVTNEKRPDHYEKSTDEQMSHARAVSRLITLVTSAVRSGHSQLLGAVELVLFLVVYIYTTLLFISIRRFIRSVENKH